MLDTGSQGGVLLERATAKKFDWLEKYPLADGASRGVNAAARMERFNLPTMTFGPYELESPVVSVPAEGESLEMLRTESRTGSLIRGSRGMADGLLGYDVLKHFVVTIDYRTGSVHIVAGKPAGDQQ